MKHSAPQLIPVLLKSRYEVDRPDDDDQVRMLAVESIGPRPNQPTRGINPKHVEDLAESIRVLGLLQPVTVDHHHRLVAGLHRLEAIKLLDRLGDWTGRVPARVLEGLDAAADPEAAFTAELTENEKRRDYTSAEVRALADRMRSLGYRDRRGRPRAGEQPLMPALQVAVGKSRSKLYQILKGEPPEKNVQKCTFSLRRAAHVLRKLEEQLQECRTPGCRRLRAELLKLEPLIDRALREQDSG